MKQATGIIKSWEERGKEGGLICTPNKIPSFLGVIGGKEEMRREIISGVDRSL